ncbi:PhoH family protein [Formicincola oecophyllae]
MAITGAPFAVTQAQSAISALYRQAAQGADMDEGRVRGAIRMSGHAPAPSQPHRPAGDVENAPQGRRNARGPVQPRPASTRMPEFRAPAGLRQPLPQSAQAEATQSAYPYPPEEDAPPTRHNASSHGLYGQDAAFERAVAARERALHDPYSAARPLGRGGMPAIRTRKGVIGPRSHGQAAYMDALAHKELVFGIGPAGTGKTYLAVAQAAAMLLSGEVERIILSRPAVEAGEKLGFLPGDLKEKIDPYLRPLYDALGDMMPPGQIERRLASGEIEVAPLAFMRGRTLSHAFVILDEAQNTTPAQMKMFLTRMGHGTRMAVTGDVSQVDLPRGLTSGLKDALATLEGVPGVAIAWLNAGDVVRHPMVGRIVDAYDSRSSLPERDDGHHTYSRRGEQDGWRS